MIKMLKKNSGGKKTKLEIVDIEGNISYIDSIKEAAKIFECTEVAIYTALKRGHIRGCKIKRSM